MKIEEAIVYCLATSNRGMRSEQIADMINRQRLHLRKDGQPVTSQQVYAVICRFPQVFVKSEGRIMLMKYLLKSKQNSKTQDNFSEKQSLLFLLPE